jgi:hypothetical protein
MVTGLLPLITLFLGFVARKSVRRPCTPTPTATIQAALLLHPEVEAVERLTAAAFPMYWTRESGTDPSQNRESMMPPKPRRGPSPADSASYMASIRMRVEVSDGWTR